jgi:hypothetical protein
VSVCVCVVVHCLVHVPDCPVATAVASVVVHVPHDGGAVCVYVAAGVSV